MRFWGFLVDFPFSTATGFKLAIETGNFVIQQNLLLGQTENKNNSICKE